MMRKETSCCCWGSGRGTERGLGTPIKALWGWHYTPPRGEGAPKCRSQRLLCTPKNNPPVLAEVPHRAIRCSSLQQTQIPVDSTLSYGKGAGEAGGSSQLRVPAPAPKGARSEPRKPLGSGVQSPESPDQFGAVWRGS